jgi:hypothetical protein
LFVARQAAGGFVIDGNIARRGIGDLDVDGRGLALLAVCAREPHAV